MTGTLSGWLTGVTSALRARPGLDVHDTGEPEYRADPDGRAHIAAWIQPSPGAPAAGSARATGAQPVYRSVITVTAVGGCRARALRAAAEIRAALAGQVIGGCLTSEEDLTGVTVQPSPGAEPPAWYLPMLFRATIRQDT